ncbi:MAG: hypothetical protein ACYSOT_00790 [Planctomycetota bacterium]
MPRPPVSYTPAPPARRAEPAQTPRAHHIGELRLFCQIASQQVWYAHASNCQPFRWTGCAIIWVGHAHAA